MKEKLEWDTVVEASFLGIIVITTAIQLYWWVTG